MLKQLLIATLLLTPVMAEAKGKKVKTKTKEDSPVVTVAPKPVVPAPVAPKPTTTPAIDAFTQSQIDKAMKYQNQNPLDNCTYCGAAAIARGEWVQ